MNMILDKIQNSIEYQDFVKSISEGNHLSGLGLPRAARLLLIATLQQNLDFPIILVTDRADHALSVFDELGFWAPESPRFLFSEPNPLFYEDDP